MATSAHRSVPIGGWAEASRTRLASLQETNGAFVASPDFGEYHYCWLRDSSFIAYALDRAGAHESAARYHAWTARALDENSGIGTLIDRVVERHRAGKPLEPTEMPPARFRLDGDVSVDDWPNYQIDGYGAWLWGLEVHLQLTGGVLDAALIPTIDRLGRYLDTFGLDPCFDVWEENVQAVHTSTLAAVYAGLSAAGRLLADERLAAQAEKIRTRVIEGSLGRLHLRKSSASDEVDASTLWCGVPFGVLPVEDPLVVGTARAIEEQLLLDGGVRRNPDDTYFGGGAWPVLSASLGWHYAVAGDLTRARTHRDWIAEHFAADGSLAEQFGGEERDPDHFALWVARWGLPARDLLWSHAMYVVLCTEIEERSRRSEEPAAN